MLSVPTSRACAQDAAKAAEFFQKEVELVDALAHSGRDEFHALACASFRLGILFCEGDGVPLNRGFGAELVKRAWENDPPTFWTLVADYGGSFKLARKILLS